MSVQGSQDSYVAINSKPNSWSGITVKGTSGTTSISDSGIYTPNLTQGSLAELKKNFEELDNALNIVKNTEIYKYNLKTQKDGDKKHIGFVIGDGFKHSNEITAIDENDKEVGVDLYSMVSVLWKAVQEQQEQIEKLKEELANGKN